MPGVFGLREARIEQIKNISTSSFRYWSESAKYGYFGGGYGPGPTTICTITRLDLSNETVSLPGKNFVGARYKLPAVSNNSYGYFAGGLNPPWMNTITRLDFSNETVSDPGKNLPVARGSAGAVSNNSYGYFGGGYFPAINTITRLDFSNETVSDPTKNLPTIRKNLVGFSNNSYGYFGGGYAPVSPNSISTITRLDFSNETVSDPGKNLPTPRYSPTSVSNNSYGYFGGGAQIGTCISTITRLDFFNEVVSDPGKNFVGARESAGSVSNNSYGYFGGGYIRGSNQWRSTITRLDFSNETVSDPGNNFPTVRAEVGSVSGGASVLRGNKTYGYFVGAAPTTGSSTSIISRLDFSSETISDPGKNLPTQKTGGSVVSNNSYGYFAGGIGSDDSFAVAICTINRLDFSNETLSNPGNNLPASRSRPVGVSNNSYGYFAGGYFPPKSNELVFSTITRLDFSNETVSNPGKNLPKGRSRSGGVFNNSYGYFGGGYAPPGSPLNSTITRLDFSNETVSDPGKNLPITSDNLVGVSNNSYGYFGGAIDPGLSSTITRLDFSNETVSNPGKNLLTAPDGRRVSQAAGVSNNSFGYFGGGQTPNARVNLISRLDFSNETVVSSLNRFLTARYGMSGLTNSN
jgi:hypothetical protein